MAVDLLSEQESNCGSEGTPVDYPPISADEFDAFSDSRDPS